MKFIEIKQGVSVRIEDIESVSEGMGLTSIVKTKYNTYNSTFPYSVLLELLETNQEEHIDKSKEEEMNILKQIGVFAG